MESSYYLKKSSNSMATRAKGKLTKSRVPVDDRGKDDGVPDPKVGMEFETENDAYDFYNRHARKVGFSIRTDWRTVVRKTGVVKARRYVCFKGGHRVPDKRNKNVKHHRGGKITGCEAYMMVRLQINGKYRVTETYLLHNHRLATPRQVHLLRSQKKFVVCQTAAANDCDSSGNIPKKEEFMSGEDEGKDNVQCIPVDSTNYLRSKRMKAMEMLDAGGLLEYFKNKQLEDPSFFCSTQLDADNHITNIFWSDGRMVIDYERFGDVVCFDTAYSTEKYGRPFAPFIGINHHRQVVIFGAAFLYDETTDSFRWLFRTFCDAMSGKKPKIIFTDQNKVMENAIKMELPEAVHRISVWHMFQSALNHLRCVFSASRTFSDDFRKCVYDYEEEDEFLQAWDNMIKKYSLVDNTWLQQLFNERERWAVVYGKDTFCADMKSILRTESLNNELERYLHPSRNILQFFEDFQRMVDERHCAELKANFKMIQSSPKVIVPVDILTHASSVYTPVMFEMFQTEYVNGLNCIVKGCTEEGTVKKYEVIDGKGHCHIVTLDSMDEATVTCSCKKYESLGILCGHVLRVIGNTIRCVPTKYILKRWTREASTLSLEPSTSEFISADDHKKAFSQRYNHLFLNFVKVATGASESEEAYEFTSNLLDKMWQDIEMISRNVTRGEPSGNGESLGDEVGDQTDSLKLTVDEIQFKEVNGFGRKMGSGSGGHSMIGFFEKPPAPSILPSNTCPTPIFCPVPTTPPTFLLQGNLPHDFYRESVHSTSNLSQESSLFGTSQQFVLGSSSRGISKE
ncbi:protein FAR1-RELATED SEQUENCE 5-like protein [Cinnamomum micranthum f. kanehirae]|uniref:Protein FAR1-RELATED SEQUENCE n=1 Tax=Cinnamomum micranthum f. kanehirae TaxID=337451 RepID=A0A3S4NA05_9MAGN|nr:protein FAR1-RELATED SEQUENCE 5-like protein [Cinnamomum micranthum f. kanehirae]